MKRADGCREGAECFWNSAEDTGERLSVNDEKREGQGLKERKASPIWEHERISAFSFLGFQKRGAADLGSPRRFRSQEGSAFLRFQGIRIGAGYAEEEWQGAFGGEKGKTGWRATGVGLEAIILRLSSKRKGPNSGKRKAGFSGGSCQGVENMIR